MLHRQCLRGWVAVAAMAISLAAARPASAGFTTDLGTASASASSTIFTYILSFDPSAPGGTAQLNAGNFITLFDFSSSLLPTSTVTAPVGFTSSIQFTGVTPSFGSPPTDSAAIENITFTYNGATLSTAANFTAQITLPGQFALSSQPNNYASLAQFTATSGGVGQIEETGFYDPAVAVAAAAPLPSAASAGFVALGAFLARYLLLRWHRHHVARRSAA